MKVLDRRTFLRGAGGVTLGLPLLGAMIPRMGRAQAATAPRRIIFSFQANGDETARRMASTGETTFELGEFLAPLEPYRNDILILDRLNMRYDRLPAGQRSDGHQQGGSNLGPWPSGEGSFPIGGADGQYIGYIMGPTADVELGNRLRQAGVSAPHRHLNYRVGDRSNHIWNVHSHGGPVGVQNPLSPETDPYAAYARIFDASVLNNEAQQEVQRRIDKRQSALDLVLEEATSLKVRLGVEDRRRLDQHTEALREIEQILQSAPRGCEAVTLGNRLDPYADDNHQTIGEVYQRIIVRALACDLTRVVNFNWSGNTNNRVYRNLGITTGHHDLSHDSSGSAFVNIRAINRHLWTLNTRLYDKLKAEADAEGTLWDNTLVVHWNELAQGNTHDLTQKLVIFAGGAQGYFRMGRYLNFQGQAVNGFSDMLLSCFHYMGFEGMTVFGDARMASGSPLPNIKA